ncbi:MAG: hypothetical protein SynsKO_43770 [Synoicihabitans sp.]
MPRKQRVEFPGAIYHIISRGNYRKDLFTIGKSGEAFESALFETVHRCGWELFAYVIMSNHYHLAVRTPEPNLVDGMKWLQSTFATRFNRFTGERGHVFQGRYKSILLTENQPLGELIDYIHLNPVRARLHSIDDLEQHTLSSFGRYAERGVADQMLQRDAFLNLKGLPAGKKGMERYRQHLALLDESLPRKRDELMKRYCRGWFMGSAEAKRVVSDRLAKETENVDWEGVDLKSLNESKWEQMVVRELKRRRKTEKHLTDSIKGALWKVEIAAKLKAETTAGNPWIANRLNMGHPNYVSNLVNAAK